MYVRVYENQVINKSMIYSYNKLRCMLKSKEIVLDKWGIYFQIFMKTDEDFLPFSIIPVNMLMSKVN